MSAGEPVSSTSRESSLPTPPEPLLVPLLEVAADVLRGLDAKEVPAILRPMAEFDRRGLTRGAARQQLLRAIETDDSFHDRVVDRFRRRPDVSETLDVWKPEDVLQLVEDAVAGGSLPLLASTLYATHPPGWAFGLGVACAAFERRRVELQQGTDSKLRESQVAGMAESRRRADAARVAAEQKAERLERDLRDERRGRRSRDAQATQEVAAAGRRLAEAEKRLAEARAAAETAEKRLAREANRAREADNELRDLRRARKQEELALAGGDPNAAAGFPVLRAEDLRALIDAAELAQRLADGLSGVAQQAERVVRPQTPAAEAPPEPAPQPPRRRRTQPRVPPGMVEDDPDALDAMLRTPRAVLVVDGYNVSMLAWGDAPPAQQRDRLLAAIGELQLRTRAHVVLVFDGADVGAVRPPRRSGVRVVFSPEGEEADAVVVRAAMDLPHEVPVVVASSDGWVAEHARQADARVVSSETLLRALRR
jgi:predicted RNA-binding protein with PIN domain